MYIARGKILSNRNGLEPVIPGTFKLSPYASTCLHVIARALARSNPARLRFLASRITIVIKQPSRNTGRKAGALLLTGRSETLCPTYRFRVMVTHSGEW